MGTDILSIFLLNGFVVTAVVLVHYEMLRQLSNLLPRLPIRPRLRVLFGLFGALIAHVVEVWIFAIAYYLMIRFGTYGSLTGNFELTLLDCSYFSFTVYTSLGLGDIEPFGHIRFLAGLEALTGLVLITWSASFMFLEMQKFWKTR